MIPHKLTICLFLILFNQITSVAQQRKPPAGGRVAVVVDERLAALRATPELNGKLVRRLGRGRMVAIRSSKAGPDGVVFLSVNVTSRTHGWIQREAVASPSRRGDDARLLRLIENSQGFDRIARLRIFLDHFPRSPVRPQALLLLGDSVEELCAKLTQDAARKMKGVPRDAPEFSYYLNHSGLDRYNRLGVRFVFDQSTKQFHYDGAAWRELIRRYPRSPEADAAQKRLLDYDAPALHKNHDNPANHVNPVKLTFRAKASQAPLNLQNPLHGLLIKPKTLRLSGCRRRRTPCRQHLNP